MQRLIDAAGLNALTISGDATPEALFDEMAGLKPMNYKDLPESVQKRWKSGRVFASQRMIMKDEASSIFASMKKDYNAGLTEILLQGYDGDTGVWEKILKSRGLISVRDMCLSFLGATTPAMWSKHVGQEEAENGFARDSPSSRRKGSRHTALLLTTPNRRISSRRRCVTPSCACCPGTMS